MATLENLSDPLWRLDHLYSCRQEGEGRSIPLVLRPEQEVIARHLLEKPEVPLYIIKSRRLGVSTLVDTFLADCCLFTRGFRGFIIDMTQADATKKMVEIVRFAVDSVDPVILGAYKFDKRNDSELRLRLVTESESEDRVIFATIGGRGGDCSMLHVSEWGPIAALDPKRSQEIRTGAFPAARKGRRVVETTWYGGKSGDLWDLVKPIMDGDPNAEGQIMFFPWHGDPEAMRVGGGVTAEVEEYFRELAERTGKGFSDSQKRWYSAKKIEQGLYMKREYPSTLDEALSVPMPGTIYGDLIDRLREEKKIQDFKADTQFPAYTFWDVGMSDFGCVWLVQFVGMQIFILDYVSRTGEAAAFYARWVRDMERKHKVGIVGNFLPHDAAARDKGTGKTYVDVCREAGLSDARIVTRCPDIWLGINELRAMLPRCYIHATNCGVTHQDGDLTIPSGLDCLDNYRRKVEQVGAIEREDPVHDRYSHGADALRVMAEAKIHNMLPGFGDAGSAPFGGGPANTPWAPQKKITVRRDHPGDAGRPVLVRVNRR